MNYNVRPAERTIYQAFLALVKNRPMTFREWRVARHHLTATQRAEVIAVRLETAFVQRGW